MLILAVHVDDIAIAGSKCDYEMLLDIISESFPVKYLGEKTHYRECSFVWDRKCTNLSMSQNSYAERLVERFEVAKTNDVPACQTVELDARREIDQTTKVASREAVGGLRGSQE